LAIPKAINPTTIKAPPRKVDYVVLGIKYIIEWEITPPIAAPNIKLFFVVLFKRIA
jgi:hypothetical protein